MGIQFIAKFVTTNNNTLFIGEFQNCKR